MHSWIVPTKLAHALATHRLFGIKRRNFRLSFRGLRKGTAIVLRSLIGIIILFAMWLLMSGVYKPLVVWLGLGSAVFAIYMLRRMDARDGSRLVYSLQPVRFAGYLGWLLVEIAKSNIAVTRTILSPRMQTNQNLFSAPSDQTSELGQVVFANSITLTPGTITVECEDDHFWVHALNYSSEDDAALADMGARVARAEAG